jgi:hypothetical protein
MDLANHSAQQKSHSTLSGEITYFVVKRIIGIQERNPIAGIGKDGSYSSHFGAP